MGFNNPYALWLLPLLGIIILMYMLKQQYEEMEISSLYLWKKVLAQSEVKKPWQKLRNNILMIMQLLAAFLIILALSNPFITTGRSVGGNIIIVIDRSGSMNTINGEMTRLDMAKAMAKKVVRESENSSVFTIIAADKEAKVEFSSITDKEEAIKAIESIQKSNMAGSIKDHLSLIKAIYKQFESANVFLYTDEPVELEDMKGEVIALMEYAPNVSINHISYGEDNDEYSVLVRITNNSRQAEKREVALYGEDKLLELKNIELGSGETENVLFEGIEKKYKYMWAEITEEDALLEDNKAYLVLESMEPKRVLLFSQSNIFMEKALESIEGLEVYKTDDSDISVEGYDLYIYDGIMPKEMPDAGALLFINPVKDNPIFQIGDATTGGKAEILSNDLNKNIEGNSFYIGKMKILNKPYWADELIKVSENTVAGAGIYDGRKIAYITFDIHDSDFPLDVSFPIFMYNITSYLTDMETQGKSYYFCGESIPLNFITRVEGAYINKPNGDMSNIDEKNIGYGYEDTNETGIYRLNYKRGEEERERVFAVNFPQEETNNGFESQWQGEKNVGEEVNYSLTSVNFRDFMIILVLLILAIEWMVYIHGN